MQTISKDVITALENLSDEHHLKFAQGNYPTSMHVLGVKNADIKLVLREFWIQIKPLETNRKIELLLELIRSNVFEAQILAFDYLNKNKKTVIAMTADQIEWCYYCMDNWVSTDYYAACVLGVGWREGIIATSKIKEFYNSENFWDRRIAIVATIALNQKARGGTGNATLTLEICKLAINDHNDMVVKAMSFALRQLVRIDRLALEDFIEKYKNQLHKRIVREVNKKLETGLKN